MRYPVSGGYKYAFITTSDCNTKIIGTNSVPNTQGALSQAEITNAAKKYGIKTSSNAYQALCSINSKYSNVLKTNAKGTSVFLFEGVGNKTSANTRMNAMCVVVRKGKIIYINKNSSTLPDYPFNPSKNGGDPMPTIHDGIYNFTTVNHRGSYAALNVSNASVVRFRSKSSFYRSSSSAINVHQRSSDSIAPAKKNWVNSAGCQLIGTKSEYLSFIKTLGLVNGNRVTAYSSKVSGKIVIDRTYAFDYMSRIGYSTKAINMIRG